MLTLASGSASASQKISGGATGLEELRADREDGALKEAVAPTSATAMETQTDMTFGVMF